MKKNLLILLVIISNIINAQNIAIEYQLETNRDNHHLSKRGNYILKTNENSSLFMPVGKDPKTLYKKDIEDIETIWVKGNLQHVNLSQGINDFAFNDIYFINESNLYYNKILFNEISFIKEDLDLFNWQILGDTKTILNYKCKKAVSSFRGRLYEAYFTEELKSNGGPWKFHGLPGTILSVRSVDDYFSIVAKSVNIQDNSEIKNPLVSNNFISIETYKKE